MGRVHGDLLDPRGRDPAVIAIAAATIFARSYTASLAKMHHRVYLQARLATGRGLGSASLTGGGFFSSLKKSVGNLATGWFGKAKSALAAVAPVALNALGGQAKSALNAALAAEGSIADRFKAAAGAATTLGAADRDAIKEKLKASLRPVW